MINASDPVRCALADPTAVAVADEMLFEDRSDVIEDQMMHDTVAEIGGEDLALDRLVHDEAYAPPDLVPAAHDIFMELEQLLLITVFESQGIRGRSLVLARVEIRPEEVEDELLIVAVTSDHVFVSP